jgi:hypothetical protein
MIRRVTIALGVLAISTTASADIFRWHEVPGATCMPNVISESLSRGAFGIANDSTAANSVICTVPIVKDSTLLSSEAFINDMALNYEDKNSASGKNFECTPYMLHTDGAMHSGATKRSSGATTAPVTMTWQDPFVGARITDMVSVTIVCSIPGQTSVGHSQIHSYKATINYGNLGSPG